MKCSCARAWQFLLGFCVVALGCAKSVQPIEISESEQNLSKIGQAYMLATTGLRPPPKDAADPTPYLKKMGESPACLKSPEDGEQYVIIWNVKADELSPRGKGENRQFPVLAYEKKGTG